MPELPEVEVLTHCLRPFLLGRTIRHVDVSREGILRPTTLSDFKKALTGARFKNLSRRGKYLLFELRSKGSVKPLYLLGHLGMTGRMFVTQKKQTPPKHAVVILGLNRGKFVFEDTRYFGRLSLDLAALEKLGPEPLGREFKLETFAQRLKQSTQAIKIKLLDQSLVAGIGNIYASEVLFRARISPKRPANRLKSRQIEKLRDAIREILTQAIVGGSTVPLNIGAKRTDDFFYFGRRAGTPDLRAERLRVYDRAGMSCVRCGYPIRRIVQAARSTFFCPRCQKAP